MSRVQLALNVNDLNSSIAFYSALFGAEPAKVRPGYANFALSEPPLKLVLLENPGKGGTINHLGVEVGDTAAVDAEQARLAEAGLATQDERAATCCYAKQDKFWVQGSPDKEEWEIYTVLADSATFGEPSTSDAACCGTASAESQSDCGCGQHSTDAPCDCDGATDACCEAPDAQECCTEKKSEDADATPACC